MRSHIFNSNHLFGILSKQESNGLEWHVFDWKIKCFKHLNVIGNSKLLHFVTLLQVQLYAWQGYWIILLMTMTNYLDTALRSFCTDFTVLAYIYGCVPESKMNKLILSTFQIPWPGHTLLELVDSRNNEGTCFIDMTVMS